MSEKIWPNLVKHQTKRRVLYKFILIVGIFFAYFFWVAKKYGAGEGFQVAVLTWSFFVFCTPIADAGFLIDFPLRLITNIRMFRAEIIVWVIAAVLNVYTFFFQPEVYEKTELLRLFKNILTHPIPFWSIIFISALGTFLSILFGDELLDKVTHQERVFHHQHRKKYYWLIMIFLILMSLALYRFLLIKTGLNI